MKRIVKAAVFGVAFWGAVHAPGAPAYGAGCANVLAPAVSVQVKDPGPRISSTKSLRQINTMAGSHGLKREGFRVLGMTEINLESGINVHFQGDPARQGLQQGLCVSVARVDVEFGLKKHFVHVPREYPRGSCQYNVVMRHEMAHVDVNRRTVRKYAEILKREVRSDLRRTGAMFAPTMAEGQAAQSKHLQQIIDAVGEAFNTELDRLHAEIDAPSSAYAAKNKCRSW